MDLENLEEWTHVNCMIGPALGSGLWYKHRLEEEEIESSPAQKFLGVLVDRKLKMSQQGAPEAQKVDLGCITSRVGSRLREMILLLCSALLCSPLVRFHLQYCVLCWSPQHRKYMDLMKQVQRWTPKSEGQSSPTVKKAERIVVVQPEE